MGVITYNGVSSEDVGVFVEAYPDYIFAGKTYKTAEIEGRHGSMITGNATYQNVAKQYQIAFKVQNNETYDVAAARVSEWLNSFDGGYARLEDTYEPEFYRMAAYVQSATLTTFLRKAGRATIQFNCMPQRFLKSGETSIDIAESGTTIVNPTNKPAKPLITIYGSGSGILEINDYQIEISEITDSMQIDCELENASSGALNLNYVITLGPNWFPILTPGDNTIVFTGGGGGITNVSIIPRWWTI